MNAMERKHEFYPMITGTMKSLLNLFIPKDPYKLLRLQRIILEYPNHPQDDEILTDPIVIAITDELQRQYERWNKGGIK